MASIASVRGPPQHYSVSEHLLLNLDFIVDPDLAFNSIGDPDPDPASKNNAGSMRIRIRNPAL
jgi:hypothetical protein